MMEVIQINKTPIDILLPHKIIEIKVSGTLLPLLLSFQLQIPNTQTITWAPTFKNY